MRHRVPYDQWKLEHLTSDGPLALPPATVVPTAPPAVSAPSTVAPAPAPIERDWVAEIGSAGVAMFDPFEPKMAILADGKRVRFMDAVKRGYDLRAATDAEREEMVEERRTAPYAKKAVEAFGGNQTLAKAFLQSLPTASEPSEVVRSVEPAKTVSLFDLVAMKAKELRAEGRSARDHEFGRALAYACDLSTSQRIEIRQALRMCGVDPSRV